MSFAIFPFTQGILNFFIGNIINVNPMVRNQVPPYLLFYGNFTPKVKLHTIEVNMAKIVVIKIKELLHQHQISLRELSRLSDIRHAALSELANQKRKNINFSHIERIAEAFNLSDIREILDLVDSEEGEDC